MKDQNFPTISRAFNILLADDDQTDCKLFAQALDELPITVHLDLVHDGNQLLNYLDGHKKSFPNVLFLDLNMPNKSGYVALGLIKRDIELMDLPIVIFSSEEEADKIKIVYRDAAHYFIIKPNEFRELKKVIYEVLSKIDRDDFYLPQSKDFILTGE